MRDDKRAEQGKPVRHVEHYVGNEERDHRDGELELRREISGSAERDGGQRSKVRQRGGSGNNREPGYDPIRDGRDDEKECGNHGDRILTRLTGSASLRRWGGLAGVA